jgi:hypothetical protein
MAARLALIWKAAQPAMASVWPSFRRCYGTEFTNRSKDMYAMPHAFGIASAEHDIAHRLTKVNHLWTNDQVERMNRTIKEATVKRYHYGSHDQLRTHLADIAAP